MTRRKKLIEKMLAYIRREPRTLEDLKKKFGPEIQSWKPSWGKATPGITISAYLGRVTMEGNLGLHYDVKKKFYFFEK